MPIQFGKQVAERALARARDGHLVLTIANFGYRGHLINWLAHMHLLGELDRVVVVALDVQTQRLVGTEMAALCPLPSECRALEATSDSEPGMLNETCLHAAWHVRVLAIQAALEASRGSSRPFYVTASDTDALWLDVSYLSWLDAQLSTRYRKIARSASLTFVAQRGHSFQDGVFHRRGATLCAGHISLAPTTAASEFMREVVEWMAREPGREDQRYLNLVAERLGAFNFSHRLSYGDNELKDHELRSALSPIDWSLPKLRYRCGLLNYLEFPRGKWPPDRGGRLFSTSGPSTEWAQLYSQRKCATGGAVQAAGSVESKQRRVPLLWHMQAFTQRPACGRHRTCAATVSSQDSKYQAMRADGVWKLDEPRQRWRSLKTWEELDEYLRRLRQAVSTQRPRPCAAQ